MSIATEKRRLSSILKPYSSADGIRMNISASQNKVRFDDLSVESVLQDTIAKGQVHRYEQLLSAIKQECFDERKFEQLFVESKRCVCLMNAQFDMLVDALLSVNWLTRGQTAQEVYKDFTIELLVAHSNYTSLVISKLVQHFVLSDDDRDGWNRGTFSDEKKRYFASVHDLMNRLNNVIPMLFNVILVQLRKKFPYFKKPAHVVTGYLHNLVTVIEYSPMFTEELLEIIFDRLLAMDVNTPRNEIEDAEFPEDDQQIFSMDDDLIGNCREEDDMSMKLPLAETLDCAMEKMLAFVQDCATSANGDAGRMFKILLTLFDNHILPTHNTHHVQFLMFYFCSFKQSYAEYFVAYLWRHVCNPNVSTPMRQASVGYIASMLARAKFVPMDLLKSTMKELSNWIHKYIQRTDSMNNNQSLKAHKVFYSVCQAVFYVVAFRSKQLTASAKNLIFLQSLQLSSIVTCQLNPLRVCLPTVATAFAGVTRAHQLAYCHTILERNARRKLATIYKNDSELPDECLDTFFPFDPYLLKKSGKRIEPIFLQYQASDAEQHSDVHSPEVRGRKRYESISEDVDDFLQECKRQKQSHGAAGEQNDLCFTYSYGVSPGFHS